jgi:CRISPR-associated endonuclease/helicase Cas3
LLEERFAINSTDDSSIATSVPASRLGRVTTSSVEMGVTFRTGMMVMQSGHSAASFVQHIGRVARGNEPGRVFVAISSKGLQDPDKAPPLRAARHAYTARRDR